MLMIKKTKILMTLIIIMIVNDDIIIIVSIEIHNANNMMVIIR